MSINCSSKKTMEDCDPTNCIWGKTNRCSKKRIGKEVAAPAAAVVSLKKTQKNNCASFKTRENCDPIECFWGSTNKCSKKRSKKEPAAAVVSLKKTQKNNCASFKTRENCDPIECFWGSTNKCSKKRSKKEKVPAAAVVVNPGCVSQMNVKKYRDRPSPPYSAADCCGMILKGNDNRDYISVKNVNGICTWKLHATAAAPKVSKKASPPKKTVSPPRVSPKKTSPPKKPVSPPKKAKEHTVNDVYLESHQDGSNKFYHMKIIQTSDGYVLDQMWGVIGNPGRRNPGWPRPADTFQNLSDAEILFQKTLAEKLKKGYKPVNTQLSMPVPKISQPQPQQQQQVQDQENITILPNLYGIDKGGKVKIWSAKIQFFPEENRAVQIVEFGQLNGKKQIATRDYVSGKGGKSALEQCTQETNRKWLDKKEKENYKTQVPDDTAAAAESTESVGSADGTTLPLPILPMLAKKFEPERLNITFPCYVQPKLDGLRCIMYLHDGKIVAQSRTGNSFVSMFEIKNALVPFFQKYPSVVLDGELYTKDIPFEVLAGIIKKQKITKEDNAILDLITYNVYDIVDLKAPFSERIEFLRDNFEADQYPRVKFVATYFIQSVAEFRAMFSDFVQSGYEGIMLRNGKGLYRTNYRSGDLLKYKEFDEDEYRITGFTEGEGRDKGAVVWVCSTPDNKKFTARPQGSIENRRTQFKNGASYIGKMVTVIHFGLTQEGIPRFPVAKDIREGY